MAPERNNSMLTSSLTSYDIAASFSSKVNRLDISELSGDDDDDDPHDYNLGNGPVTKTTRSATAASFDTLQRDYNNAIDCLVNCESLINDLQERLIKKDGVLEEREVHIGMLEKTIVSMSLQLANLRATEDELKLEQRRKGSIAVTKDDLSFLGDNDNIMLSRSLVVNALQREFKEQITNCSAGDTAVAAGNNNNNENGQRRKSADEGRKGIMINPLQRTGRRRRQSMPTSSTTADVQVDNSDKTTLINHEIKAAQPTNTLSTAAAKYKPTSHRKGRRRGSGDSNNKNNNKGPKRKSLLDFHQTSNSSGSEDQSVDVPIANNSTHSDDDDDTPPWDNTQPQQSQSQPTTEEKKTFTPQAIQPKQRSSIWPRPLRKSIESSTSTFVEEDETNLDVSCWDERDKETLDISTYSLPLLDRTESTVGTRGSFDVLGLFTRRGSGSNRLSTSTKEGTTRSSLRTSQSSTEYDGIDESFQTAQQHHTQQQQQQPERRPSRHCNALQKSNRSFLSNVVFAESFEDVVSKGCTDILRNSLTKRLSISDRGREKNEDELRIRL